MLMASINKIFLIVNATSVWTFCPEMSAIRVTHFIEYSFEDENLFPISFEFINHWFHIDFACLAEQIAKVSLGVVLI